MAGMQMPNISLIVKEQVRCFKTEFARA